MIEFKTPESADEVIGKFVMADGKMLFKGFSGVRFVLGASGALSLKCRNVVVSDEGDKMSFVRIDEDPATMKNDIMRVESVRMVCDTLAELDIVWAACRDSMRIHQAGMRQINADCQAVFDAIEGKSFERAPVASPKF